MYYAPDPGGVFRSDVHRRVAGHLPLPDADAGISTAALYLRLEPDAHSPLATEIALAQVLEELGADGLAVEDEGGWWKQTGDGIAALTGPIADEPPPLAGPALEAAEAADAERKAEDEAVIEQAKRDQVERLRAELEEAEANADSTKG
jgi:hypothetical protein